MAELVIDDGDVEGQLPGELVPELTDLKLNDDVADLLGVEQQQIDEEFVAVDGEVDLPADEGEPRAELGEDVLKAVGQGGFDGPLAGSGGEVEEVEDIGVLDDLLGLVGVETSPLDTWACRSSRPLRNATVSR